MAALSFKKQFVDPIKMGFKTQTIRAFRKIPIKAGDRLYLYTGMRTRRCKKIGEAICATTTRITVDKKELRLHGESEGWYSIERLAYLNAFAVCDGFKNWDDLIAFWIKENGENCFPFKGEMIQFWLVPKRRWKKQVPKSKLA